VEGPPGIIDLTEQVVEDDPKTGPQPATAAAQALPGPPSAPKGPQTPSIPTVVARPSISAAQGGKLTVDLSQHGKLEENIAKLLAKDLELAQHDRALALLLFETHLKRGEVLDQMTLSMPVATVIGDNTGAALKALELTMKAGERVHKAAELLVAMGKTNDANALKALQLQAAIKGKNEWGDEDLPK
jgi:hypothetical protein